MKRLSLLILSLSFSCNLIAQGKQVQKFKTNLKFETIGTIRQLFFWPGYFNTLELELCPKDWEKASLQFWVGGFYKTDAQLFGFIPVNNSPISRQDYGFQFGGGYRHYVAPFKGGKWEKLNGNFYLQPTVVYQKYWINEPANPPMFSFEVESVNAMVHLGGQFRLKKKWIADISTGWGYQFGEPSGILISEYVLFHPRIAIGYEIK